MGGMMDKNGKKEVKQEKFSLNDGQTQGFLTAQKEGVKKILGEEISEGVLNNFLILNEVFADLGAKGDLLENEKTQSRKGGSSTSAFFNCCPSDNKNKEEDVKMDFEMLNQVILLKQLINGAYIFENEEDKKQLDGLFLRSDINWNMCDEQGISLLGFALSDNKNHALVSKLIENGADVNFSDKHGYTPLMYAVKYPYMVEYLLQNGANVHQKDNQGETALHKSINSLVDYETVLLLLEAGADVNCQNKDGLTPFSKIMVLKDCFMKGAILRGFGADISLKDKNGKTALDLAKENASEEIYRKALNLPSEKALAAASEKWATLKQEGVLPEKVWMYAAEKGDAGLLYVLLKEGFDVNYQDPNSGQTALHKVFFSSSIEAISVLFEHGADVNKQDKKGTTGLMIFARHAGSISWCGWALRLCLLQNPDLSIQDCMGYSALHHVAHMTDRRAIEMLVQSGADVTLKDQNGHTPADVYVSRVFSFSREKEAFCKKWLRKDEKKEVSKNSKKHFIQKNQNQNEG